LKGSRSQPLSPVSAVSPGGAVRKEDGVLAPNVVR